MLERISSRPGDRMDSIRKRNIQAVLGLLKMRGMDKEADSKNFRIQKNDFQKSVLRDVYKITRFPSKQTREDLALLLNHTNRGIQIWFQNQRNNRDECKTGSAEDRNGKTKRGTLDIMTLIEIIENNIPKEKKLCWEEFINYVPQYY